MKTLGTTSLASSFTDSYKKNECTGLNTETSRRKLVVKRSTQTYK